MTVSIFSPDWRNEILRELAGKVSTSATAGNGQCTLALSGGNLVLTPLGGNYLYVNGMLCTVPSGGVSLAATGLTPSTLYYIYATQSGGVVNALVASTTGHVTGLNGVEVMSGDATRTLVGMARPVTGPAWVDSLGQRFVRSWFNRPKSKRGAATYSADRSTTSATFVELNTEIRNEFLIWADEAVTTMFSGWGRTSGVGSGILVIGLDGSSTITGRTGTALSTSAPLSCSGIRDLSEGYHYASIFAEISAGGTFTVFGTGDAVGALFTTVQ
ncbi:hypothetical protein [Mesorhizobium sp. Pch-S]|uniref:hypothetical protein n=1 Tax=Mesorhizobium sp. Pch-S TaxID=2082387 RepID=UPI0010137CA8|nr:hypothetical protein [Mesorhizobium sp. Pch-S]QAZ46754.1 hypothetical protein C1M53_31365 [Mesorhizobium sp. Pch-S]